MEASAHMAPAIAAKALGPLRAPGRLNHLGAHMHLWGLLFGRAPLQDTHLSQADWHNFKFVIVALRLCGHATIPLGLVSRTCEEILHELAQLAM